MEALQAEKGTGLYQSNSGVDTPTMSGQNSTAREIMRKARSGNHDSLPQLRQARATARPATGSPYDLGRNRLDAEAARQPRPISTINGAMFHEGSRVGHNAVAGPSGGKAPADAVQRSRRALRNDATTPEAEAEDDVVYQRQGPVNKRLRSSLSPVKHELADLRRPLPASTNPQSYREQSIEQVDSPYRPATRASGRIAHNVTSQTEPEAGPSRMVRRSPQPRSISPAKHSKPPRVLAFSELMADAGDPITQFSEDEEQAHRKSGPSGPQPVRTRRPAEPVQRSRRHSNSPKKTDAEEHIPNDRVEAQPRSAAGRTTEVIPSSNLSQRLAIASAFCDPQTDQERKVGRRNLRVEELETGSKSITLLNSGSPSVSIPLECLRTINICQRDECLSLALVFHLRSSDSAVRRHLCKMLDPCKYAGRADPSDLHKFLLHFRFFQEASLTFVQIIRQLSMASHVEPKQIFENACHLMGKQSRAIANQIGEAPVTRQQGNGHRDGVSEGRDGGKQNRRPPRPSHGDNDMTTAVEAKGKGKGKGRQKTDVDQSTLPFTPSSDADPPEILSNSRRSTRISDQKPSKYAEGPIDVDPEEPKSSRSPVPPAPVDKDTVLFPYPLQGRSVLAITKGDRWRVESGEFLNDTVLEWALKHVLSQTEEFRPDWDIHLFNSFFFNKIGDKGKRRQEDAEGRWPAYDNVRKWTKSTDIFSKRFVIVPINEELHWYLAVIYNPGAILNPQPATDHNENAAEIASFPDEERPAALEAATKNDQHESEAQDVMDVENCLNAQTPKRNSRHSPALEDDAQTSSSDPLDCISDRPSRDEPSPSGPAIQTDTRVVQDMERLSLERVPQRPRSAPLVGNAIDATILSGIRPADESATKTEAPKKKENAKDIPYNILEGNRTWVFTFDSLGSAHKGVAHTLYRWLKHEAKDKKGINIDLESDEMRYVHAQVPLQANFSDCGLYLVHYVKTLLSDSEGVLRFLERKMPPARSEARKAFDQDVQQTWGISRDHNLRQEWVTIIDSLQFEYQRLKAERGSKESSASKTGSSTSPQKRDEPLPPAASQNDFELVPQPSIEDAQPPPGPATEDATSTTVIPEPAMAVSEPVANGSVDQDAALENAHQPVSPEVEPSTTTPRLDLTDDYMMPPAADDSEIDLDIEPPAEIDTSGPTKALDGTAQQTAFNYEESVDLGSRPADAVAEETAPQPALFNPTDQPDVDARPVVHTNADLEAVIARLRSSSSERGATSPSTPAVDESVTDEVPGAASPGSPVLVASAGFIRYKAEEKEEETHQLFSDGGPEDHADIDDEPVAINGTPKSASLPSMFQSPAVSSPFLSERHPRSSGLMNPPSTRGHAEDAVAGPSHRVPSSPLTQSRPATAMTGGSSLSDTSTRQKSSFFNLHPRPAHGPYGQASVSSPTDPTAGIRMARDPSKSAVSPTASTSGGNARHDLPHQAASPGSGAANSQSHLDPSKVPLPPTASSGPRGSIPPWQRPQQSEQPDQADHLEGIAKAGMPQSAEKLVRMFGIASPDSRGGPSRISFPTRDTAPRAISVDSGSDTSSVLSDPDSESVDDDAAAPGPASEAVVAPSDEDPSSIAADRSRRSPRSPQAAPPSHNHADQEEQPARGKRRKIDHTGEHENPTRTEDVEKTGRPADTRSTHGDVTDKENDHGDSPDKENHRPPRPNERPSPMPEPTAPLQRKRAIRSGSRVINPSSGEDEDKDERVSHASSVISLAAAPPSAPKRRPKTYGRGHRKMSLNPGVDGSGQSTLNFGNNTPTTKPATRSTPKPSASKGKRKASSSTVKSPRQSGSDRRNVATGLSRERAVSIRSTSDEDEAQAAAKERTKKQKRR